MAVTSYYQHSQGGRGTYLEKKLASSFETYSLSIEINRIPFWLEYPDLYKKKGLFALKGLSPEEKRIFRTTEWDWIGDRGVKVDMRSIIKDENAMVLIEIKNRVDTGGVGARREILTSEKFGIFVEYLSSNKKLFRKNEEEFSLIELLENFGIKSFELYIGVLSDKGDSPATVEADKIRGFYSSSKQGFKYLKNQIKKSSTISIIKEDSDNLQMDLSLTYSNIKVKIGALYGDDITSKLFRKYLPVSDLLLLRYDDIWLSQLITIDERAILLRKKRNYMTTFLELLKRDKDLRVMYDNLINSECEEDNLIKIASYLLERYSENFENELLPDGKDKEGYLADVIQVLCACEA